MANKIHEFDVLDEKTLEFRKTMIRSQVSYILQADTEDTLYEQGSHLIIEGPKKALKV